MLHVFAGTNGTERGAAWTFLKEGGYIQRDVEEISGKDITRLKEYAESISLFGDTPPPILIDAVDVDRSAVDAIVPLLNESTRTFVLLEKKEARRGAWYKTHNIPYHAAKAEEQQTARFNTFSLADALCARDKRMLWVKCCAALRAGVSPEEIVGVLFWQLKLIRLTDFTKDHTEADAKEFSYAKAKKARARFSEEELEEMTRELLLIYHEGHAGRDMDILLERWILRGGGVKRR